MKIFPLSFYSNRTNPSSYNLLEVEITLCSHFDKIGAWQVCVIWSYELDDFSEERVEDNSSET